MGCLPKNFNKYNTVHLCTSTLSTIKAISRTLRPTDQQAAESAQASTAAKLALDSAVALALTASTMRAVSPVLATVLPLAVALAFTASIALALVVAAQLALAVQVGTYDVSSFGFGVQKCRLRFWLHAAVTGWGLTITAAQP